jgi:hypothetical protein
LAAGQNVSATILDLGAAHGVIGKGNEGIGGIKANAYQIN